MRKRYWLGIGLSLLLVLLMARSVDLAAVADALGRADFAFLLPALGLYFAGVFVRTLRWAVLLRPVQPLGLKRLFVVLVVGFMANDVLPLRAGEAVRAYMLWRHERLQPGATVATIVVERILDGLVLVAFLIGSGLLMPLDSQLTRMAWFAGAAFAVAILGVVALAVVPGPLMSLLSVLLSPLPVRLRGMALRLTGTFVEGLAVLRRGRHAVAVVVLSLFAWLLEAGMYYVLLYSFPLPRDFSLAALGTAVANLASMVPSSPGYVGTFDAGLLGALTATGFQVDRSVGAAYTTLVHAALILPVTLLGFFFVWREGLSLKRISSARVPVSESDRDPSERSEIAPRRSTS